MQIYKRVGDGYQLYTRDNDVDTPVVPEVYDEAGAVIESTPIIVPNVAVAYYAGLEPPRMATHGSVAVVETWVTAYNLHRRPGAPAATWYVINSSDETIVPSESFAQRLIL